MECYTDGYDRHEVECIKNICTCIGGKCRTKSCPLGSCKCDATEHHTTLNARCVRQAKFNETCKEDESCIFILGICNKVCVCRSGYLLSEDKTKCSKGKFFVFLYHM